MAPKYPNIATALIAFQSEIPRVEKLATAKVTGKGASYEYDYATLDHLTEIVMPKLTAVGLAFTAAPTLDSEGRFVLRAKLLHESGEALEGDYPLVDPRSRPQEIGSAITYARRYALTALTGVAPVGEDDDGATAQNANPQAAATPAEKKDNSPQAKLDAARAQVASLIQSKKITSDQANEAMRRISKSDDPDKWTAAHYNRAYKELSGDAE